MTTHKELQDFAEFDHPFIVAADGSLSDAPDGIYAPDVYNDELCDIVIDGDGWGSLRGFTGQYGYHGAVMHASEFIGGGLADYILSTPGIYVVTVVNVVDEDDEDAGPAGWAILRRDES